MTQFIQSRISNQAQKVDTIRFQEAVKPVYPVIPEPRRQTIPILQKDQSYPIPPEIITNMNSPIQNKETQQNIIKKEIKPQAPPEPTILHDT